jgi:hypothetical protein
MIDLENQHREAIGERPLVDGDLQPRLDSSPRYGEEPLFGESGPLPRATEAREARRDPGDFGSAPHRTQPRTRALPIQPMHFSPPARQTTPVPSSEKKRWPIRSWMVILAILVAAAVAGMVVAMSGPDVAVHRGK